MIVEILSHEILSSSRLDGDVFLISLRYRVEMPVGCLAILISGDKVREYSEWREAKVIAKCCGDGVFPQNWVPSMNVVDLYWIRAIDNASRKYFAKIRWGSIGEGA